MMDTFQSRLMEILQTYVDMHRMEEIEDDVTRLLYDYEIRQKNTEIVKGGGMNEKIVKNYIASLRLEGKSEKTVKQYFDAVTYFLCEIGKNIEDITTNDIRYHLASYRKNHSVSNTTVDNKRRYLSAFFQWMSAEEIIPKNPMLRIKRIKDRDRCRKSFSDEEIEMLRDSAGSLANRAIIEFLLSTGCRVSELVNIDLTDIDFNKRECTIVGKGNKERIVFINQKAMHHLKQYINKRDGIQKALWINARGNRMSAEVVRARLKKIATDAGVKNVYPHRFRRTMASDLSRRGMPVQYIQRILGHEKIETTMLYCDTDDRTTRAEFNRMM